MKNRCDSVDALRYAYYEMMRIKEENQMLEKNKDYVEFTLQYTSVDWERRSKDCPEVCLKGYSDFSFPGVPIMDVVCNEFDHKVVVVSKRDFEKLQTENKELKQKLHEFDPIPEFKEPFKELYSTEDVEKLEWTLNHICGGKASANGWMVTAKLWRRNYETLSKLIGFSSTEEIQDYLTNEAECDTLQEAISKLHNQVKYTCDEWYSANSRNNSWKAAAECNSPKELIEKLNLLRDDISGRSTVIESYKRDIKKWQAATGRLSPEDISTDSLISKCTTLEQEVKILNGAIQEWKEGTGCPSPSAVRTLIESGVSWHHAYNEVKEQNQKLGDKIKEWKEATGCPDSFAAKALIESGMSYEHGYHEVMEKNRKLTEEVESWKHVTGYSTPEDYLHARINNATPFDYTAAWQDFTGCTSPQEAGLKINNLCNEIWELKDRCGFHKEREWKEFTGAKSPEDAKKRIKALQDEIDELTSDYSHLLTLTGFDNEGEIEDFLEQNNDRNKLTTVIDNLKLENEAMKAALRASNLAMQKELENEIDKWQKATGRIDPEAAKQYIDRLKGRLNKIHGYSVDW